LFFALLVMIVTSEDWVLRGLARVPLNQLEQKATSAVERRPYIWAIASGKGGVGKSFVASNLGMALAKQGKKVVLVDLDLGSANLHTCLGIPSPKTTLSHIIEKNVSNMNDFIVYGHEPNLGLISGASDSLHVANLLHYQKLKIMRNLSRIDADYIILDLGAGTNFNTLDFFLFADQGLLVVIPEPTSIENGYRFFKSILTRQLKDLPSKTKKLINQVLTEHKNEKGVARSFAGFLEDMEDLHPAHAHGIHKVLSRFKLNLIVNQVIEPADTKLGAALSVMFRKYFDTPIYVLGYLYHDNHVLHALRQKQAYYAAFPQSRNATCLERMALEMTEQSASGLVDTVRLD